MRRATDWRPRSIWRIAPGTRVLPVVTYLGEAAAGVLLGMERAEGWAVLAVSLTLLLLAGIHNAWDITVWSITRRRE